MEIIGQNRFGRDFVNRRSRVRVTHPAPDFPSKPNGLRENKADKLGGANGTKSAQNPTESLQKLPHRNLPVPALSELEAERFWALVDRGLVDNCWNWRGALSTAGYGRFKLRGKLYLPHRVAYRIACGEIVDGPEHHGAVIMHRCDNPRCCNPAHLALGTQLNNVVDMDAKGRGNRSKPRIFNPTAAQIYEIIHSPKSAYALAEEWGAHPDWINRVRREHWVDTLQYKYGRVK